MTTEVEAGIDKAGNEKPCYGYGDEMGYTDWTTAILLMIMVQNEND